MISPATARTSQLEARPVEIDALRIVSHDGATTTFEAECGKGTYVRAIARDLGLALGCLGHVAHLRRTRVGPFAITDAVDVETLRERPEQAPGGAAAGEGGARADPGNRGASRRRAAAEARPERAAARARCSGQRPNRSTLLQVAY